MAAREVTVNFFNKTKLTLELVDASLEHGDWEVQAPSTLEPIIVQEDPQTTVISSSEPTVWKCVSDGVATGVEGEVNYRIPGSGMLHLWWDNPFVGNNSYDQTVPLGFQITRFEQGGNSALVDWTLSGEGLAWHGWQGLDHPSSGPVTSAPAVESRTENGLVIIDVFVRGQEGALWQRSSTDGGATWGAWAKNVIKGTFQDAPAAVSPGPNRVDVFVRGMDNKIGHLRWDGSWHGWQGLDHPSSGPVTSAPTVESRTENGLVIIDVFVRGQEGALWQRSSADGGATWGAWAKNVIKGTFQDAPAAVSPGPNQVDVFVRGMDNKIGRLWWS